VPNGHAHESGAPTRDEVNTTSDAEPPIRVPPTQPKVAEVLRGMGLLEHAHEHPDTKDPPDLTREPMRFPVTRPTWLQALARGESGALVCLAYSSLRGYGGRADHGTVAELRVGDLPLRVMHPLTGEPMTVGWFRATEVEMVGGEHSASNKHSGYGLSYGLVFGQHERKAIAMALLDSTLQAAVPEEGEPAPANDQEMVLSHIDGIESFGFIEHLKLPHFVTFGSSLRITAELQTENASSEPHDHGDGVLHAHA
jgi:alpha-D-ribose 1-methylphosphonate 5-triphosphate synthase subunit PhnI